MARNEPESFDALALPHLDTVYRVAVSLCRDVNFAEDLAQITFTKGLKRFGSFRKGTNIKAWLLRILHNTWIDELRHRKVVGPVAEVEEQVVPDRPAGRADSDVSEVPDTQSLLERFGDEQIIDALQDLPEEQRVTLFLVDVEELTHDEAAGVLGIAVGTVKSRSSRARQMLKERLHEHAADLGFLGRRNDEMD